MMLTLLLACSDYDFADDPKHDGADTGGDTTGAHDGGFDDDGKPGHGEGYLPGEADEGSPDGRVATVLLTFNDAVVPRDVSAALTVTTVGWLSPVEDPHVLVILDDNNGGEDLWDVLYIEEDLLAGGLTVTRILEPLDGISVEALTGVDVVVLSNPGHPPDDAATFEALARFSAAGFGLMLQGDDMTRPVDGFDTSALTRLGYLDNGETFEGHTVDNDKGESYTVTLGGHDIVAPLEGTQFAYGNDIDSTTVLGDSDMVAATAVVGDSTTKVAITAWRP